MAAPPIALLSALMTLPMVMAGRGGDADLLDDIAVRALERKAITPPAAKPLASDADRPVARMDGACGCEDVVEAEELREARAAARRLGVVASSCTTMPLPPVAEIESWPLVKLALPLAPSAVLSAVVKLPTVVPMLTGAAAIDRQGAGAEIDIDPRYQIAAGIGDRDGGLAGEIERIAGQQAGIAAGQRGGRRIGGIGVGLGVEGLRDILREIAQALGETAQGLVAHVDQALERAAATDADPARWPGRSTGRDCGLVSWIWILP